MITNGGVQCVPPKERTKVKQVIKWCKKNFKEIKEIEIFYDEINLLVSPGMTFEIVVEKDIAFITGVFPSKSKDFFKTATREYSLTKEGIRRGLKETVEAMKTELGIGFNSILRKGIEKELFFESDRSNSIKYPSGYEIKPIKEQIRIIQDFFPKVKTIDEDFILRRFPYSAESWFVVPRWQIVDKTYSKAVQVVMDFIKKKSRNKFYNWCECQSKSWTKNITRSKNTEEKLNILAKQQKDSDALIIPAQFGYYHRNRNLKRASEVFLVDEFALGIFEIGCMILTHPKRFNDNCLWVDCADEYENKKVLCFTYRTKKFGIELENHSQDFFSKKIGVATGFIP